MVVFSMVTEIEAESAAASASAIATMDQAVGTDIVKILSARNICGQDMAVERGMAGIAIAIIIAIMAVETIEGPN